MRAGDFGLDLAAVTEAGHDAKLVFLCSPNNPTGQLLDEASILELCRVLAAKRSSWWTRPTSSFPCVRASLRGSPSSRTWWCSVRCPRPMRLRARCGALLASEAIVGLLRRILPPYALPASSVEAVLRLTAEPQRRQAQARIDTLRGERERMRARLVALPAVRRILSSDANFLLAEFAAPQALSPPAAPPGFCPGPEREPARRAVCG